MADHFLDTETRHDIPLTALTCVRAGLSTAAACDVWRYEVSPAVAFNLWNVAGEWAAWDCDWLVERIERQRNRPGMWGAFRYRLRVHCLHGVWQAIERCMDTLWALPSPAEREQWCKDWTFLARHYFDFCPKPLASLAPADRRRIASRYPEPLLRLLGPALVPGEAHAAEQRLRCALDWEKA